jgi:hypothetical protein
VWVVAYFATSSDVLAFKSLALQLQSATWRSQKFSSIDNRVNADGVANLIQGFARAIVEELTEALEQLAGQTSISDFFIPDLESILKTTYDWNCTIKKDILKYDFEPYVVEPLASWDPAQMEAFKQLRTAIPSNTKVISSVSLGLVGSVSLGGARVSHVERKARILVEAWFCNDPRDRRTSAHTASSDAQPSPTMSMSIVAPPAPAQQTSAPAQKKGVLCC